MPSAATSPGELHRAPGAPPILHVRAADPVTWAQRHRDGLRAAVVEHGAILVRGLEPADAGQVGAVFARLADGLMVEREAFAPRRSHGAGVYASTKWPASQPMCMHHELSYTLEFPGLLLIACLTPPARGGATGLADATAVLDALPGTLVERFRHDGWLLVRSFGDDIGASWTDALGTDDPAAVERYCRANGIAFSWLADGTLRTRQRRSAVVRHPVTGRRCWFNQVAFLNRWTLEADVHDYLVDVYGEDGLPFDTRFGNGDPIGADVVGVLNDVYAEHTVRAPWQAGDLLIVDNIATAHSREPYTGPREMLVGLADPVRVTDRGLTPARPGSPR